MSDGPDVDPNMCLVVKVVVDGETAQYIVPGGPGKAERFQKQLFDGGMEFGKAVSLVNKLKRTLLKVPSINTTDKKPSPKPECGGVCYGRDEVGPPVDCWCGQRPFNCMMVTVCG
jgi:hypothetical protein